MEMVEWPWHSLPQHTDSRHAAHQSTSAQRKPHHRRCIEKYQLQRCLPRAVSHPLFPVPFPLTEFSDITPEIISRYCDWKICGSLPLFGDNPDKAFYTCRNVARKAAFSGSEGRPSYLLRPNRTDPRRSIERNVLPVIRAAALKFAEPLLLIPLEWKTVSCLVAYPAQTNFRERSLSQRCGPYRGYTTKNLLI
jgi:hypothetical protein